MNKILETEWERFSKDLRLHGERPTDGQLVRMRMVFYAGCVTGVVSLDNIFKMEDDEKSFEMYQSILLELVAFNEELKLMKEMIDKGISS